MGEVIGMGVIVEGGHPITQGLLRRQHPVQERLDSLAPGLGVLVVEEVAGVGDLRVRAAGQDADLLLGFRYERRADLHQGLLELACSLICPRRLQRTVNRCASSGDGLQAR